MVRLTSKQQTSLGPGGQVRLSPGRAVKVEEAELEALLAHGKGHGAGLVKAGVIRIERDVVEPATTTETDEPKGVTAPDAAPTEPARRRGRPPKKADKTEAKPDDDAKSDDDGKGADGELGSKTETEDPKS